MWTLVEAPPSAYIVDGKWVFANKYTGDGVICKHKGRYVLRSFHQIPGLEYDKTWSGVVRFKLWRMCLAVAVRQRLIPFQLNFMSAYLNGKTDKVIYMRQPEGFAVPGKEHLVCRLNKPLYGTMQAGHI